ncbi:PhzF family phenazine biosynthesis protein [Polluticaenibacter yanchengensis]|uniref:PhzF family phenazine biosynthesis protein n=1 Tax=Polluticaenibacter yanchengensis TaxID=3014562 RepID=A0ABT4UKB8_9BACT|nr:PhzF family phenazine biosynthesis protein [Chitinophagaceae bacterium LY-5]
MTIKLYQVDAFTNEVFRGNPAAVCPLEKWLPDEILQKIAAENNLSETAFIVQHNNKFEIRWFTPTIEVDLCGHATLAGAYVLFNYENYTQDKIEFYSPRSGQLTVTKNGTLLALNFPTDEFSEVELTGLLKATTDKTAIFAYKGKTDYMLLFNSEEDIITMKPDLSAIAQLAARGLIVTAKGNKNDFVSRFFAPAAGVNEDPVTGSAHTTLIPYWAGKLGKTTLTASQLSERHGTLYCRMLGNRVEIAGSAVLYLKGEINI